MTIIIAKFVIQYRWKILPQSNLFKPLKEKVSGTNVCYKFIHQNGDS